jgi:hypothetical protein
VDGAEVVGGEGDVCGDLVVVGVSIGFAAGGGAFAGEAAEAAVDEVDVGVELSGFVAEAVRCFHDIDPDGE